MLNRRGEPVSLRRLVEDLDSSTCEAEASLSKLVHWKTSLFLSSSKVFFEKNSSLSSFHVSHSSLHIFFSQIGSRNATRVSFYSPLSEVNNEGRAWQGDVQRVSREFLLWQSSLITRIEEVLPRESVLDYIGYFELGPLGVNSP